MNKVITIIFLGMSFGCSSISEEYKIANTLLGDEKYLSKKADLIMSSNAEIDNFFELDKYLSELGNPNKLYSEFSFQPGFHYIFTKDDVQFIKSTVKRKFSWDATKIQSLNITVVKRPVFNSEEQQNYFILNMIKNDHPLLYLSKPYFNRKKNKAIVAFYTIQNYESYFLIKENNNWKVIGRYSSQLE